MRAMNQHIVPARYEMWGIRRGQAPPLHLHIVPARYATWGIRRGQAPPLHLHIVPARYEMWRRGLPPPCLSPSCLACPCLVLPCLSPSCLACPCSRLALPCLSPSCLACPCSRLALPCLFPPCLSPSCLPLSCLPLSCLASPVEAFNKDVDGAAAGKADLLDILFFADAELKHLRLAIPDHFHRGLDNRRLYAATADRAGDLPALAHRQFRARPARRRAGHAHNSSNSNLFATAAPLLYIRQYIAHIFPPVTN